MMEKRIRREGCTERGFYILLVGVSRSRGVMIGLSLCDGTTDRTPCQVSWCGGSLPSLKRSATSMLRIAKLAERAARRETPRCGPRKKGSTDPSTTFKVVIDHSGAIG